MREEWERETRALREVIEALKEEVEGEKRERDEGLRANWQDLRELKERVQVLEIWRCDAQKQQHNESEEGILIVQKNFTCDLSFSKEESDALNDTIRLQYSWEQLTDEMEGKPETKEKGGQAEPFPSYKSTSIDPSETPIESNASKFPKDSSNFHSCNPDLFLIKEEEGEHLPSGRTKGERGLTRTHSKSASCGFGLEKLRGRSVHFGSERVQCIGGEGLSHNLRSSFEEPPAEGDYIVNDEMAVEREEELEGGGFNTYSLRDSFSSADHNVQVVNLEVLEDSLFEREARPVKKEANLFEEEEEQDTPRAPLLSEVSPKVENKRYSSNREEELEKTPLKYKERYSFRSPEIVHQMTNYTSHAPSDDKEKGREVLEIEIGEMKGEREGEREREGEEKEDEEMERLKADEGEVRMLRTIEPKEVLTPGRMSKYRSNGGRVHTEGGGTKKGSQFGQSGKVVVSGRNGRAPPWKRCKCKSFYEMVWEYRAGEENSSLGVITESVNEERKEESGKKGAANNSLSMTVSEEFKPRSPVRPPKVPRECSDYCINLRPEKQRRIIKEELEFLERANRYRFKLQKNNKRFLVSAAWWARWKDFVEFEVADHGAFSLVEREEKQGSAFLSQLKINVPSLLGNQPNGHADLLLIQKMGFEYPGPIKNQEIMQPGSSGQLRSPLLENYDYIAVTDKVWRYLRAWYDCDVVVARLLVRDQSNPQRQLLELYPKRSLLKGTELLSESTLEKISREVRAQLMSEKTATSMIL